jgi:hypothetical protein
MVRMIAHTKLALDQGSDPILGPDIAHKTIRFCAALQQVGQARVVRGSAWASCRDESDFATRRVRRLVHEQSIGRPPLGSRQVRWRSAFATSLADASPRPEGGVLRANLLVVVSYSWSA